jgi:hypothetical protein
MRELEHPKAAPQGIEESPDTLGPENEQEQRNRLSVAFTELHVVPCNCRPEPFMKIMLFAGLILVVLGIASLLVPIPHTEKHGIKAGDVSIGVETTQSERVSPIISVVLIAGGIALTVGGARTRSSTK